MGEGAGGKDADNFAKENSAWVLDCGLDIQFTDGSDYTLRMPVLWSFYYLLEFPTGKWLKTWNFNEFYHTQELW